MSVNLYDKAFLTKLHNWTENTKLNIVGPSETTRLFEMIADKQNDKPIDLPMLVLTRPGGYTILDQGLAKHPLSYDGATLDANREKACQLNAIPISIPYQLDIYARYFEQADEYTRNLVFNIINYPKLPVTIPYNGRNYIHDSNIRLSGSIEDNSDIPQRLVAGQFTRMTMELYVDDAYLWDIRYRDVYSICCNAEVIVSDNNMKDDFKDAKIV